MKWAPDRAPDVVVRNVEVYLREGTTEDDLHLMGVPGRDGFYLSTDDLLTVVKAARGVGDD